MASKGQIEGSGWNQRRAMRGLSRWPAAETPHGEQRRASGIKGIGRGADGIRGEP